MKNKFSLFLGRFQPLHAGHRKVIDTILEEGGGVVLALRLTGINLQNPYGPQQRVDMIRRYYPDEGKVQIVMVPDCDEIIYGREPGYVIRQIKVGADLQSISATKIREGQIDEEGRQKLPSAPPKK